MTDPINFLKDIHPNPDEFICISCIFPTDRLDEIPVEDQKRVLPVDISGKGEFIFRLHPLYIVINLWMKRKDFIKKLPLLHALNKRHWGIYYSTAGFGENLNENGNPSRKRDNVRRIQILFADFDFPTDASRAFEVGQGFDLLPPPNYIVRTSENKLQAIWLAARPMNFETAGAALLYISTKTGGDAAVKDLARVLRLPGFKNTKLKSGDWPVSAEKRHDQKLDPSLVEALASAGRSLRTSPSSSTVKGKPARPSSLPSSGGGVFFKPASAPLPLPEIGPVPIGRALKKWEKIYENRKSKTLADWGLCCYLRGIGASEETMFKLMRCAHDDDGRKGNDEYYRDTARRCLEEGDIL